MSLQVIGTGLGRTGTYSLKLALNALGLGPTYHMEEVILDMGRHLPQWQAAVKGTPDWKALFDGYQSAVDWPTASYYRELHAAYPEAKFVHTVRSAQSWAESFGETIQTLLRGQDQAPPHMREWLDMATSTIAKAGVTATATTDELVQVFEAHTAAVQAAIAAEQLLVFEVKAGWAPLCEFLSLTPPETPFPRSNDRQDFWDKVKGATK